MLKMFVWDDVLRDWTPGLIAVLANDIEEARALVRDVYGNATEEYMTEILNVEPDVYEEPTVVYVAGGA
jgi:hypothetical protein